MSQQQQHEERDEPRDQPAKLDLPRQPDERVAHHHGARRPPRSDEAVKSLRPANWKEIGDDDPEARRDQQGPECGPEVEGDDGGVVTAGHGPEQQQAGADHRDHRGENPLRVVARDEPDE